METETTTTKRRANDAPTTAVTAATSPRLRTIHSLVSLPHEVLALLLPFLTGFDLLRLSHTNRHLLHHRQLAPSSSLWRDRCAVVGTLPDGVSSWKQMYCSRVSLRFPGGSHSQARAAAVDIHNYSIDIWENESFSFDVGFSLLPANPEELGAWVGGVVLGAQSEDWQDEWTPDYHEIFVYVTPQRVLECSMGEAKMVVAKHLELHRWYHLAVTFDHNEDGGIQSVYLNGELIHTSEVTLASEWEGLHYMQLATGFVGKDDTTKPRAGWLDFNGVIDSFHVYEECLPPASIELLSRGETPPEEAEWTLVPSELSMVGTAQHVHCTRPLERVCTDIKTIGNLE